MISPTYGELSMSEIAKKIENIVLNYPDDSFNILIGTDSQNFDTTKTVVVIVLQHIGKGGIFFYEINYIPKIFNIRQKLFMETQLSLSCADSLLKELENLLIIDGFDYSNIGFSIHVDAGYFGKTKEVIPEIVAWVNASGYECVVKPDSSAASSVADRLSK